MYLHVHLRGYLHTCTSLIPRHSIYMYVDVYLSCLSVSLCEYTCSYLQSTSIQFTGTHYMYMYIHIATPLIRVHFA